MAMAKRGKSDRGLTGSIRSLTASHCTDQVQVSENTSDMQDSMDMPSAPSGINEKALTRKIDLRILPTLFIIYVAAFLDRVNIGNALTLKLPKDLHLVGNQSNIALTIFFVPYILFEIPSNILLRRFKPHVWLSGCILAFGIVMLAQGFVKNYSGLLATRFFLGLAEAGIFPGSFYIISCWYKREEAQKRFAFYFCSVIVSNMFGGLLASAISKMDGDRGYHAWRWVFILEGIATILIGFMSYFALTDFPEEARWLTEEERRFVIAKAGTDEHPNEPITFRRIFKFLADGKPLAGGLMYFGAVIIPLYSFSYFAPTIVKTLNYSVVETQLHTVPPFAAALALCLIMAYWSDRLDVRSPFIAFGVILNIAGLVVLMKVHHKFHVEYAGLFLAAMGTFANGPIVICWFIMNLHGHTERSIGSAWLISFGNCGGIIATFTFLSQDAPYYHTGYSICLGMVCLGAVSAAVYGLLLMIQNKRRSALGEKGGAKYYSL